MLLKRLYLVLFAVLLLTLPAVAGRVQSNDLVSVGTSEAVADNLLAVGKTTDIRGLIAGDLLSACRDLFVSGQVEHNVYAAAQSIRLTGSVGGDALVFAQQITVSDTIRSDLRGACQNFTLTGWVGQDLIMAAQDVVLSRESVVSGDLFAAAEKVTIDGFVQGKALVGAKSLTIGGLVAGDLEIWAETLRFTEEGRITGDLIWHAESAPTEAWAEHVAGSVYHRPTEGDKKWCWSDSSTSRWPGRVYTLVAALVTALFLIGFFRPALRVATSALSKKPFLRLGVGLLGVIVMPVTAAILIVLTITLPVGLILLGLYPMFLYLAWLLTAITGGILLHGWLRKSEGNPWLGGLLGIVLLWLLALIPAVGGIICLVATSFGFGLLLHGLHRLFFRSQAAI